MSRHTIDMTAYETPRGESSDGRIRLAESHVAMEQPPCWGRNGGLCEHYADCAVDGLACEAYYHYQNPKWEPSTDTRNNQPAKHRGRRHLNAPRIPSKSWWDMCNPEGLA